MAIPKYARKNFETLLRAAENDSLALMECKDATTGEDRYVICAVQREDNGEITMVPFGHLAPGNPFDLYVPPTP